MLGASQEDGVADDGDLSDSASEEWSEHLSDIEVSALRERSYQTSVPRSTPRTGLQRNSWKAVEFREAYRPRALL